MVTKGNFFYPLILKKLGAFGSRLSINYYGLEHLANIGYQQTIYAANHPSGFDPFILIPSIMNNPYARNKDALGVLAAKWIQKKFWYLDRLGVFSKLQLSFVGGDKEENRRARKKMEEHLREYKQILIFPEGWLQRNGKMREGMYGMSDIALRCALPKDDVLIVPISITYYPKPRPKKRSRRETWWYQLQNLTEFTLDTIVQAKQYYHTEIDINFGKPLSVKQLQEEKAAATPNEQRQNITQAVMDGIRKLSVVNANQVLAQYFLSQYEIFKPKKICRYHDKEEIFQDISLIAHQLTAKYFLNNHFLDVERTTGQALDLFAHEKEIIEETQENDETKYIVTLGHLVSEPPEDDVAYAEKNFLRYTANQIAHLPEVRQIIETVIQQRISLAGSVYRIHDI